MNDISDGELDAVFGRFEAYREAKRKEELAEQREIESNSKWLDAVRRNLFVN